jgi:GNAT superfamily N-acetyltransferase
MLRVRRYVPTDLEDVVQLWLLLHQEAGCGSAADAEAMASSFRGYLTDQVATGTLLVWVAERDRRVVSTASILRYPIPPRDGKTHEGSVINVVTRPGWRRKGIAVELMREVAHYVETSSLRRVWLRTTRAGRGVYTAAGFNADPTFMVYEPVRR